jgi:putative Holliday junction resolvase
VSAVTDDLVAFAAALPPDRPVLGLDLGDRTIGVAVSDVRRMIASPLETLPRAKKFSADAAALAAIAAHRSAAGVVMGWPKNMDGSEGPRAQASRAFARSLGRALGLPVALWDERLSTVAVERTLLEADSSRKRRAEVIDKLAAAYILQGALDRIAREADQPGDDP